MKHGNWNSELQKILLDYWDKKLNAWDVKPLGTLGEFRNGVNFKKSEMGQGLGLINVKDLYNDNPNIDFSTLDKVDLGRKTNIERYFIKKKDLFFVRSSVKRVGIGLVRRAPISSNQVIHCGFIIRFRLTYDDIDSLFLTYILRSPSYRGKIIGLSSGATITNISQDSLASIEIPIPPLLIQKKIVGILSAYDDLIENNTRRIQILEVMAQRIYREWFVRFCYPGHENDQLVESELGMIPEGWEVKTLGDVLSVLESGSRPRGGIDPNVTEIPSIGAENVLGLGKYDYSKEKFVTREYYEGMRKGHIKSGDVLLYKDGAKLGRKSMFKNDFPHNECCINEHVFILRTNELCSQAYLYFWLDLPNVTQGIINLNSNAAQPGINQRDVKSLQILVANPEIRIAFDNIGYPILKEIFNLAKKNNNLLQSRDILLPKLISGKIDVLELDIDIGEGR